jgi:phasin family protein
MLQESLHEFSDMAQNYKVPGNPQEMVSRQTEFARKSFETAVKNASEVADLVKRSGVESVEILRTRIKDALQEIRDSYEKTR